MKKIFIGLLFLWGCSAAPLFQSAPLPEYISAWGQTTIPNPQAKATLLFYPGGLVAPHAYLPILGQLSKAANLEVIIAHMPFDLAVLSPDRLDLIQDRKGPVFIGGHSLGGAMAAEMIQKYPDRFSGLLLWAAYPANSNNLSGFKVPVMSIGGMQDGLATPAKLESAKKLLPQDTQYILIEGANHAQFAHYGKQDGDGVAKLSRSEQQDLIVKNSAEFVLKQGDQQ
jgi:pimeloyl-ACP methyl ester carboxylesterase